MNILKSLFVALLSIILYSCAQQSGQFQAELENSKNSDGLFVVDCLLPGQIRKLGQLATYLTARRPIKTTASDCEIRGGEYVAYDRASYATALKVWLPRAEAGEAEAQAYVGEIYEKGMGLTPNYQLAKQWYQKAAEQGNTRAQVSLGYLYEKGLGVPKDMATAFAWYQKSSGLEKTDIPYAATIESSSDSDLKKEIKFLQTALKNSRNETKNLEIQLSKTQLKIQKDQQKLIESNTILEKAKKQLNAAKKAADNTDIGQLQKIIRTKEHEIKQQRQNITDLEKEYQKKVKGLNNKLDETRKRAEQIAKDLKSNSSIAHTSELKLLDAQAKLATTEKQLFQVKQESLESVDNITSKQLSQTQKAKLNFNIKEQELQNIQAQLKSFQQIKNTQQASIEKYQAEQKAYQENISQLQQQLKSSQNSGTLVEELNNQLETQKLAAQKANEKFLAMQSRHEKTLQWLEKLEKNSWSGNKKLKQLEEKYKLLQKSSKTSSKKASQLDQQLKNSEAKWLQQQKIIRQLESEKQKFEKTISKLQKKATQQGNQNKPKIEIIDPPFVIVRGTPTVTLRSVVKQRDVIGKVTPPSGILSLMVNDSKESPDDQGLFKTSINLINTETPVKVVAVNKKGTRASLDFVLSLGKAISTAKRAPKQLKAVSKEQPWKSLDFGQYYALIIGNSKYKKIPALDTPKNDATQVAKILKSKYGFKTTVLLDGSRYQILSALNKLRGQLKEKDNLLIYYAGHGELDKVNMRGHWLPIDADADNTANWISTVAITDILNMMAVKHILVVSDSCYSGAMTRASLSRLESGSSAEKTSEWMKAMLKAKSRTVLTSGGLKPVMDGGGGSHSVFANAFINALKNNNTLLEGQSLYRKVSAGIVAIAAGYGIEQVPEYAPIRHAGHESGEFFFRPKS